ncbi:MAG TPA: prepilin-type N-terminal cleavage/methylation domain-containing protein [Lacunisphaera sp.]|nr:prepilin-type N-terminal cleavage/methylation domain-containing protein [Lacunisphaera sp.]
MRSAQAPTLRGQPPARARSRRAFTLVEVLLSLALLAMLLVALNQFLLSMGELWGRNREQRLFDQHVRAVARYVEDLLQRGTLVPDSGRRLRVQPSVVAGVGRGPLLTFDLPAGDRMLPWPGHPLPDVQCALDFLPGRGLVLYWQSRWELDFEKAAPRALVLSPFVSRVDYEFYRKETRTWAAQDSLVGGDAAAKALPARCRLHFEHDRLTAEQLVRVPPAVPGLPAF